MISSRFRMIRLRQRGSSGLMRSKAHAQAVFEHGHGVVAESAEGAQIVALFMPPARR